MELQHKLIEITKRFTDKDREYIGRITGVDEEHEQEHLINVETTLQLIEQKIEETDNANIHS